MQRHTFRTLSLLIILGSLILLACDLGLPASNKPTVILSSPPHGSQFREGEDVAFQSTAMDSTGVTRVELVIDGAVVKTDAVPGAQAQKSFSLIQTWKATQGTHTASVRAYNVSSAVSDPATISITVSPAPTPPPAPTAAVATSAPTTGSSATATPVAACTNASAFVSDVTVPDGTALAPGQTFNKIWRVRNSGTCPWGTGYQLVFVSGEAMTASTAVAVPDTAAGATADLLVAMTASTTPGAHAGQWRLKSPAGTLFGASLSVSVNVTSPAAPTATTAPPSSGCSGTPSIASFTATSMSITVGGSTTLQWGAVTGADSVDIDHGIGGVAAPGNTTVSPGSTTTYTMTAHCGANTATKQVTITVTGAPAFAVTSATASVDPASFTGSCSPFKTFNFSGQITVNGAGTVSYRWERSDGTGDGTPSSLTFGSAGSQTVTSSWSLSASGPGWKRIHILAPGDSYSNQANFTLTCAVASNDFSNFTVISTSANTLTFHVNYHYTGDHGASSVFASAYAENASTAGVPGSGYGPATLTVGDGIATITITRITPGAAFTSTQVRVCMYTSSVSNFYCEVFSYTKSW